MYVCVVYNVPAVVCMYVLYIFIYYINIVLYKDNVRCVHVAAIKGGSNPRLRTMPIKELL